MFDKLTGIELVVLDNALVTAILKGNKEPQSFAGAYLATLKKLLNDVNLETAKREREWQDANSNR